MDVRHVALFCSEHLLGESLALLLKRMGEIELIGPWLIDEHALGNLAKQFPDIVLIADGEQQSEQEASWKRRAKKQDFVGKAWRG